MEATLPGSVCTNMHNKTRTHTSSKHRSLASLAYGDSPLCYDGRTFINPPPDSLEARCRVHVCWWGNVSTVGRHPYLTHTHAHAPLRPLFRSLFLSFSLSLSRARALVLFFSLSLARALSLSFSSPHLTHSPSFCLFLDIPALFVHHLGSRCPCVHRKRPMAAEQGVGGAGGAAATGATAGGGKWLQKIQNSHPGFSDGSLAARTCDDSEENVFKVVLRSCARHACMGTCVG